MLKKFRKIIATVLIMISVFTMFGPVALASENNGFYNSVENTNDFIAREIEKAIKKADKEVQKYEQGKQSEKELNKVLDEIIEKLLEKTESKVDKLIKKANREGIEITKEYIEVQIYDRIVLVDPLYAH